MITITTGHAEDAWKTLLTIIMKEGDDIEDEDNFISKELLNLIVTIEDPKNSDNPSVNLFSDEKLKKYRKQFLDHKNYGVRFSNGNRLREHFGFKLGKNTYRVRTDQVESVINRLKNCETTRRATMSLFDPSIDQYQNDIPAMIMIDYKIRHNKLYTTAVWRSHDIFREWIPDFFGLTGLADHICGHLDIGMGPITMHSVSAHIFKPDYSDVIKKL